MTQNQTTAKVPARRKLSQDLLDELNMLSALVNRTPETPAPAQK